MKMTVEKFLLNDQLYILDAQKSQETGISRHITTPGSILLQSPFTKNSYQLVEHAEVEFAIEKYHHFCAVCAHLGARSVSVLDTQMQEEESSRSGSVKASAAEVGDSEVKLSANSVEQVRQRIEMVDAFEGGDCDLEGAARRAEETGLCNDTIVRGLIDMAKLPNNRIKSRELNLSLTTETSNLFRMVVRIGVPQFLTSVAADFEVAKRHRGGCVLKIRVEF